MTKEEILQTIKEKGFFVYHPRIWNDETDITLEELMNTKVIQYDSKAEMNHEYTYIPKD